MRDVVDVVGPDAESFLQGQLSQDVAALAEGAEAASFLLQPQGKVDALLRVRRVSSDAFRLDVDEGFGQAVVDRLTRFKLRVKCDVTLTGPAELDAPWGSGDRVGAGWPAMGAELDEKTIPGETGMVPLAVSFTKGCYTGQELVARIDSRGGNVPRRLRGIVVQGVVLPPEGTIVHAGGKDAGTLTSVAWSPRLGAPVALAYVRRAVEPPADVELRWEGGAALAQVLAVPLVS